jgi:hypothetical protein
MIVFFALIVPLLTFIVWKFFKVVPLGAKKQYVLCYNILTFLFTFFLSFYFAYDAYNSVANSINSGWVPILAFMSFFFSFLIAIIFFFLIRNFLIFRNKK